MPRKPRFNLIGVPQHVIQRGNNREPCFYAEMDYRRYQEDLQEAANKYACRIHAYVLMTNHVHLLVTPMKDHGVSEMMQSLGRRYVYYINKTYHRTGTLWERESFDHLIRSEEHHEAYIDYIECNPVTAGLCNRPQDWRYSSARFTR